jgi:hypothetical protein
MCMKIQCSITDKLGTFTTTHEHIDKGTFLFIGVDSNDTLIETIY